MKSTKILLVLILLTLANYNVSSQQITPTQQDSVVILSHDQAKKVVKDLKEQKYLKEKIDEYKSLVDFYKVKSKKYSSLVTNFNNQLKIKDSLFVNQKEISKLQRKEIKQLEDKIAEEKKKKWLFSGGVASVALLIILL